MPGQGQTSANKRRTESSTQERTLGKRTRVSRACDQCRTAREKCDGQPTCSTCAGSKRSCTYTANPKKRGIQPGYIRTLELALTWLFNNSDAENLLNQKLAQDGAHSVLIGKDSKDANKLHRSWRRSKFCKDVDRLLSGGELGLQGESRSPESDDQDSDPEDVEQAAELTPHQREPSSIPQQSPGIPRPSISLPQSSASMETTSLPVNRWRLFDIYFAYTHPWLPICEKHDILKLTYSYPDHGLSLSSTMVDSGDHAELWSILALSSIQELASSSELHPEYETPERLYNTARSLIPLELGSFQLGHVKALLLLALINLSQSTPEAAWLLIGYASRILLGLERRRAATDARFQHVFAGCFMLDNIISTQLMRPPSLRTSDLERVGNITPDGLEEWQPWTGCLDNASSRQPSRTPALSLSSFNHLAELAGITSMATISDPQRNIVQEALGRIEMWKASLQPMFDHIRTEHTPIPVTPPAMNLQIFYCSCVLLLSSSQAWLRRVLDTFELFRGALGSVAMPPILHSLLDIIARSKAVLAADKGLQARLRNISNEHIQSWSLETQRTIRGTLDDHSVSIQGQAGLGEPLSTNAGPSIRSNIVQIPTPESLQIPFNPTLMPLNPETVRPRTSSALLDDILPDMNTCAPPQPVDFQNARATQDYNTSPFDAFHPSAIEHRNSTTSRDIENFFDELASLDGAERLENQPQFMQNLGFAPDANIADLFGQVNPLISPYIQQDPRDAQHFDQTQFFGAG